MKSMIVFVMMLALLAMPVFAVPDYILQSNASSIVVDAVTDCPYGNPPLNSYDDDLDTYYRLTSCQIFNDDQYIYFNYTKNSGYENASWLLKWTERIEGGELGTNYQNYSVPSECFSYLDDVLMLRMYGYLPEEMGGDYIQLFQCRNNTGWEDITGNSDLKGWAFYEEALYWYGEYIEPEEESGMDPLTASVAGLVSLILILGLALAVLRNLVFDFSFETVVGIVVVLFIVLAGVTIITGLI